MRRSRTNEPENGQSEHYRFRRSPAVVARSRTLARAHLGSPLSKRSSCLRWKEWMRTGRNHPEAHAPDRLAPCRRARRKRWHCFDGKPSRGRGRCGGEPRGDPACGNGGVGRWRDVHGRRRIHLGEQPRRYRGSRPVIAGNSRPSPSSSCANSPGSTRREASRRSSPPRSPGS
jgi:hypothetical protein